MKIIESASDSEYYAKKVPDSGVVLIVPAFQGLGAPYWDPYARGTIVGLTRGATKNHLVRAVLESMAYQTADVLHVMEKEAGVTLSSLKVDGGAAANNFLLQFQADVLGTQILRPHCIETTALGAATLAGLAVGLYRSVEEIAQNQQIDRVFASGMDASERQTLLHDWSRAVERSRSWDLHA
jgi:glycerol kinase